MTLKSNSLTAIVGPNGCGKTTTLSIISGKLRHDHGELRYPSIDCFEKQQSTSVSDILKIDLPKHPPWALRKRLMYVMPQPPMQPTAGLRATLAEYAALAGLNNEHRRIALSLAINRYALEHLIDQRWEDLSSGERVKFALACGSIARPSVMLLDEPLSPLDEWGRLQFISDLKKIASRKIRPASVLFSTHNIVEAERFCDEVLIFDEGELKTSKEVMLCFEGSLFRVALDQIENNAKNIVVDGLKVVPFAGWIFLRGPSEIKTSDVAQMLTKSSISYSSIEDVTWSGVRPQIESALRGL